VRYILADVMAHTAVNKHPDDEAVDTFAQAMHAKMAAARAKGKEGWDDPDVRGDTNLWQACARSLEAHDWVDVANYAMMLWNRGQK
jgi:hypothetical protein